MALSYPVKVFATRGSEDLARQVCEQLRERLPKELRSDSALSLGRVRIDEFSNGNILVQIENVRENLAVVIHTQVPPVDKRLIELFHLLDAINNARAADILLVFPCMPYARSDRKNQPRISTFGRALPAILTKAFGVKRVILLDPHDSHLKHYFEPAADEISAIYLLVDFLAREIFTPKLRENSVVVFSDTGAAKRYEQIPNLLQMPEAYISKQRNDHSERPEPKRVVGEVNGKICLLVDDEILTGGTVIGGADLLLSEGAKSVYMLAVHPIFAKKGHPDSTVIELLKNSPVTKFIVTDTVPVRHKLTGDTKIIVVPVAKLLAEAIKRTVLGESLTDLHRYDNVFLYR